MKIGQVQWQELGPPGSLKGLVLRADLFELRLIATALEKDVRQIDFGLT